MLIGTLLWSYRSDKYFFQSKCDFENASEFWNYDSSHLTDEIAQSGKYSFVLDSTREFSATFSAKAKDVFNSSTDRITASAFVFFKKKIINPQLAVSIEKNDSSLFWLSSEFSKNNIIPSAWNEIVFPVQLPGINIHDETTVVKIYFWNIHKEEFSIDDFEINVIP